MNEDVRGRYFPLPADIWPAIQSLWNIQVKRHDAEEWALKEMKFLVYDDTEANEYGYDSNDDEDMLEHAIRMSMHNENSKNDNAKSKRVIADDPEFTLSRSEDPNHPYGSECGVCSGLPEFPYTHKTRKFRLINPVDGCSAAAKQAAEVQACSHYVAVSYRWPEAKYDEQGKMIPYHGTYQVRDTDGKTRKNRALDDVLDRAVDFANCHGLRMIWIDQECLPQPTEQSPQVDKDYQKTGLQAMDIVYNRAMATAGLHDGIFTSQEQLSMITSLIEFDKTREAGLNPTPKLISCLLEFLKMVCNDLWYTRAWVVQEAMSSGSGLSLVFGRGANLRYPSTFRKNGLGRPKHSLDSAHFEQESSIVCIPVRDFQRIIRSAKYVLDPAFDSGGRLLMSLTEPILSQAETLHPHVEKSKVDVALYWGNAYGGRQTVDAAGAMTLLNTRKCRDCHDRIVIMANMCSYDLRLDTDILAKYCPSLRIGYLALALLNGDLSLLVPELYEAPMMDPTLNVTGLLSPFDTHPGRIDHCVIHDNRLRIPRFNRNKVSNETPKHLRLPAHTWTIDNQIDLSIIQEQWKDAWNALKCVQRFVPCLEGESELHHRRRKRLLSHQTSKPGILDAIKMELLQQGFVSETSPVWGGYNATGVQCKAILIAQRVESSPKMQRTIGQIFFSILRYLLFISETDPRALGVANSIWHSVRVDAIHPDRPLPNEVCETLFEHLDVVQNPFKVLQLDRNRHATYNQIWIIDRIMQHGTLWSGRYNPFSTSGSQQGEIKPNTLDDETSREVALNMLGVLEHVKFDDASVDCSNTSSSDAKGKGPEVKSKTKKDTEEIISSQMAREIMATQFRVAAFQLDKSMDIRITSDQMAFFIDALNCEKPLEEVQQERALKWVSVFDVDGPCLVATPFNSTWERLPRPTLRGMSICWVVQAELRKEDSIASEDDSPINAIPVTSKDTSYCEASSSTSTGREGLATGGHCEDEPTVYRVLGKVKGMWQLMDWQVPDYRFV